MRNYFFYIIFLFFLLKTSHSFASHIVGGDFKITMTSNTGSGANYIFQLRLYKDEINANFSANIPTSATIGIYDAVTHSLVSTQYLNRTSLGFVTLGDPCYTPDPNVVKIEEGIFINSTPKFLANNPNGYYIQYQAYARNGIVLNMQSPSTKGITILAMFPDPAIGQNSSPDFGVYPPDAYFCANNTKLMNFPVVDSDGDSLVYSFVDPLNSVGNSNGSNSGSGAYPFYTACPWGTGYSLNNIVGGSPVMSIDPSSGIISATPSLIGYFVFTVRVEEYRNGIKIGEVRRDVQYASLPCSVPPPPALAVNGYQGTFPTYSLQLDVNANDTVCFDIDADISDPNDSVYIQLSSANFNLVSNYQSPNLVAGSTVMYNNWENTPGNNVTFNANNIVNGYYGNLSNVYLRYCWAPLCNDVDSTFEINFDIYSVDVDNSNCAGGVTNSQATLNVLVTVDSTDSSSINTILDTFCIDYVLNGQTYNSPGTYSQSLTNYLGCDSTIILELYQSIISLTLQKTDESCTSGNGSITANVSGGSGPYSYSLNGGASISNNVFNNLSAGNYSILALDSAGCSTSQAINIVDISGPYIDSTIFSNITCLNTNDGSIEIFANGPNAIQYSIDSGLTFQNTNVFNNLSAGAYYVAINDVNCTVFGSLDSIIIPDEITISYVLQSNCPPCTCNSSIDFTSTNGGVGALSYSIDSGVNFQASPLFTGLCAGTYDIVVKDVNNCSKSQQITINSTPPLNVTLSLDDPSCSGYSDGQVQLNSSGGSGSVTVSLNGGVPSSNNVFSNLNAGMYNFTITDSCSCAIDTTITLTDPPTIEIDTILITDELCFGNCSGFIEINSPSAVSYVLSGTQNMYSLSSNFDSLCSGNYMVYVENINGCLDSQAITINSPPQLVVSSVPDTLICIGGTITSSITASGGTGNIDYFWSNGMTGSVINWSATNDTSIFSYVIDDAGCYSDTAYQNIQLYPPLSVSMPSDTFMCNSDTMSIYANASGGIGSGYSYLWNSGLSDTSYHLVDPIFSVNYIVSVTDGCETPAISGDVYVTVYPLPVPDFTADTLEGCVPVTVNFEELVSNNLGTCQWDFGDLSSVSQCGIVSHTYNTEGCWDISLTYTDTLNCTRTQTYDSLICSYEYPVTNFFYTPLNVSLVNNYVDFINTSSSNATQFLWELGDSGSLGSFTSENFNYSFENHSLGIYPVCLTSSNDFGCATTLCSSLELNDDFIFYIPNSFTADGDGRNDDFGPVVKGADEYGYRMYIFNRWGEIVFDSYHVNIRWSGENIKSGKMCNPGVYVWRIELYDIINFKRKEFFGNVTLVR